MTALVFSVIAKAIVSDKGTHSGCLMGICCMVSHCTDQTFILHKHAVAHVGGGALNFLAKNKMCYTKN